MQWLEHDLVAIRSELLEVDSRLDELQTLLRLGTSLSSHTRRTKAVHMVAGLDSALEQMDARWEREAFYRGL